MIRSLHFSLPCVFVHEGDMGTGCEECAVAVRRLARQMKSLAPISSPTMAHESDESHCNPGFLPVSLSGPVQVPAEASSRIRRPWSYTSLQLGASKQKQHSEFFLFKFLINVLQRFRFSSVSRTLSHGWSHVPPYVHLHFSLPHFRLRYLLWFF